MPGYSVCKIVGGKGGSNNTMKYVTLLFAEVALVVAMVAEWSLSEKGAEENGVSSTRGH